MERNFITRNGKLRWGHLRADVSEFAVRTFTKHIYFQGLPFIAFRWSNSVVPSCVCGYNFKRGNFGITTNQTYSSKSGRNNQYFGYCFRNDIRNEMCCKKDNS